MSDFVRFDGLKELEKSLRDVSKHIKGNPLRTAARAMTVPFQERAEQHADLIDDAETRTNISLAMDKRLIPVAERDRATAKGDSIEIFEVGPRKKGKRGNLGAWYAHFVEFGTDRQSAQPFMRPAFNETRHVVMATFTQKLTKTLDLAVKRVAKLKSG